MINSPVVFCVMNFDTSPVFKHSFDHVDINVMWYYRIWISFCTFIFRAIKPLGIAEEREERRKQKILNQQRLRKERKLKQQDQKTDQTNGSEKNLSGQGGRGQSSEETEKRERGPESETDGHELTKPSFEGQGDVHSKMSIAR